MKSSTQALADPQTQAGWFEKIREAHQTETAEDYVELIADLIEANGEARVADLAARFGVSNATVSKVITRLNREGYVINKPYRSLFLSDKGRDLAAACKERHEIVLRFLLKMGVPKDIAEFDAEGIEHHISAETLAIFKKYADKSR